MIPFLFLFALVPSDDQQIARAQLNPITKIPVWPWVELERLAPQV